MLGFLEAKAGNVTAAPKYLSESLAVLEAALPADYRGVQATRYALAKLTPA